MAVPEYWINQIRKGNVQKFYNSGIWKRKRQQILIRDNFECQLCKKQGKVTIENLEVHHIKEIKKFPELALDDDNLITICGLCHSKEHKKLEKMQEYNRELNRKKKEKLITPERW